jgi:chemotaxis protein MotB
MKQTTCFIAISLFCIASSCVAPKKFQDLQAQKAICDDKNEQLKSENDGLREQNKQHQELEESLNNRILKLQDTIAQLIDEQRMLNNRYADLMQAQEALQTGSRQEIRKLLEQIQQNQEALQQKENQLFDAEKAINDRTQALQKLERELNERNQKLIALQHALTQKDSIAQALRKKVADALLGFEGKGLTVTMRDGKVYVSLDEKLLFASGSATVDSRGVEAIGNLAKVLEQNPDINVTIEGHTDDVPYKGSGQLLDNWDLSVKRATSVVRIMLKNQGIEQSRVTAAGRAEFVPLRTEKTPEARQANRRIEVILAPKLDEVFKLLEN